MLVDQVWQLYHVDPAIEDSNFCFSHEGMAGMAVVVLLHSFRYAIHPQLWTALEKVTTDRLTQCMLTQLQCSKSFRDYLSLGYQSCKITK